MKILFITYTKINGFGGASIEARKYYDALKYMQIREDNFEFKVISLDNNLPESFNGIELKESSTYSKVSRIMGHSYYMYYFWKKNKKRIMVYEPDVVILGRTKLGFIAKDIHKNYTKTKIVSDVDNIEVDYIDAFSEKKGGIKNAQLKMVTYRDEKDAVQYSDYLMILTKRNLKRLQEKYNYKENAYTILPICMDNQKEVLEIENTNKTVVFFGTLEYIANHESLIEFMNKVWIPNFSKDQELSFIIAGSKPRKELCDLVDQYENVKLVKNYRTLTDIVPQNSLLIAPLIMGAGMKTKIAEGLSLGLLIAGSKEAWIGYENINVVKREGVFHTDLPDDYVKVIQKYKAYSTDQLKKIGEQNKALFEKNYSYSYSRDKVSEAIKSLVIG